MKTIRKLHFYIGVLFAPTIVFFALSGACQILGLHEGPDAVGWVAKLALIHKNQTIESRTRPPLPKPGGATFDAPKPEPPKAEPHRSLPLIVWFLGLALALTISTGLGIYMAFAYKRDRVVILALLGAGILVPLVFVFL